MKWITALLLCMSTLQGAVLTLGGNQESKGDKSQREVIESFYDAFEKNSEPGMKKVLSSRYKISSITEKHQTAVSDFDIGSPDIYMRMKAYHSALPNLSIRIERLIVSGNAAVAQVSLTGIQKGVLFGIAPTNRYITIHAVAIFTIENGQIVDIEEIVGEYNLMKQLRYIPI